MTRLSVPGLGQISGSEVHRRTAETTGSAGTTRSWPAELESHGRKTVCSPSWLKTFLPGACGTGLRFAGVGEPPACRCEVCHWIMRLGGALRATGGNLAGKLEPRLPAGPQMQPLCRGPSEEGRVRPVSIKDHTVPRAEPSPRPPRLGCISFDCQGRRGRRGQAFPGRFAASDPNAGPWEEGWRLEAESAQKEALVSSCSKFQQKLPASSVSERTLLYAIQSHVD